MQTSRRTVGLLTFLIVSCVTQIARGADAPLLDWRAAQEGDFSIKDFRFASGETLPELRIHYRTLGAPKKDAKGVVRNAVIIGHGTGGSGGQFIRPEFAGELFGRGQPLDAAKYFIVLADGIGHGKSSKPSDGLRAKFPRYGYRDMVDAQYRLLKEGLGVNHLRLVMGTSMGGMHAWVWGERYPDFMDALLPLASLPTQISGRNRIWRKAIIDAIRNDPSWQGGNYTAQPASLRTAQSILYFMGSNPQLRQAQMPTLAQADTVLDDAIALGAKTADATDILYQVGASWDYDPNPELEKIRAPLYAVNSADDLINPPELGILEREIKRVKQGKAVVIPLSADTRGHGSHTIATLWKPYLEELLDTTDGAKPLPGARQIVELHEGWRFHLGAAPDEIQAAAFNDSSWERVTVPHNWNRMGGSAVRGPDYQNVYGQGWYRLRLSAPSLLKQKRAYLQFDGASVVADVWLNGTHLGQHRGAFGRFRFDVTQALKAGNDNWLVVRADNSKSPPGVIPFSGDWPMYGGLYRNVSLVVTNEAHIDLLDFGGPGVYAQTSDTGVVNVLTRLKNDATSGKAVRVVTRILDDAGTEVVAATKPITLAASAPAESRETLKVPQPRLWNGTQDPYLYSLRVELHDAKGTVVDEVVQPLGIRSVRIDANTGFYLNGKPLRLRGVSKHQDRQGKSWAIDRADLRRDFALIREIGANTVRFAHYQHSDFTYELADRNGFIAWAEIPLVDRASMDYAQNAEQHLRELIRQNFNHPSIAVWSIGNEMNLDAAKGRVVSNAGPVLKQLNALVHSEDPSRLSTLADCCGSVPSEARPGLDTVAGITDVIGFNRYFGWYSNKVGALTNELTRLHAMYPRQAISVSEYGAGGALTQHTDNPLGGPIHAFGRPHPEEFQSYILEESWKQIDALPFVWSSWVWNMFDFSNDSRMEGDLVDTNDKGLITFDRQTKKDGFYFFKANWSAEPVLWITGRRYVDRAYPVTDVRVYSNAPEVRLKLGTKDLGSSKCEHGICAWKNVALAPGENTLTASAASISDTVTWRYLGKPSEYFVRAGSLVGGRAVAGTLYGSDQFFTGGEGRDRDPPISARGATPAPKSPVANVADQLPYETYREGRFSYRIPVSNGTHDVTLRFFEPVKEQAKGARVFDVTAEGKQVVRALDIAAEAGGPLRAVDKHFKVSVSDGLLDLSFDPKAGNAIVSALEIVH